MAIWGASGAPTGRQTLVHLNGAADALKWPKMDEFSKFLRPDYLEFYHKEIGVGPVKIHARFPVQIFHLPFRRQSRSRTPRHNFIQTRSTKMVIAREL